MNKYLKRAFIAANMVTAINSVHMGHFFSQVYEGKHMEADSMFAAPAFTYATLTTSPDVRRVFDLKYSPLAYAGEVAACNIPAPVNDVASVAFSAVTFPGAYVGHAVGWGLGKITAPSYLKHAPYLIGPCNT